METIEDVIEQLNEQNIDFEILQDGYSSLPESPVNKVVSLWQKKFIGNRTAPYLDHFLWHIFSYRAAECLEKEAAVIELKKQGSIMISSCYQKS